MNSNTDSTGQVTSQPAERPAERGKRAAVRVDRLAGLTAAVEELAAQDLDRLTDVALAEQVLGLRRLVDRLEGHWLQQLAAVDARGAAGADQDQEMGRPRRGSAPGCAWDPALPPAVSGPPGPGSAGR
jgi:hypothetical protein